MKSIIVILLLSSLSIFGNYEYNGGTLAAVTMAGGIIKSKNVDTETKKYKRKDCPVCKGTGKYLSGDGIKMVDCGYCEPDTGATDIMCDNKNCKTQILKK